MTTRRKFIGMIGAAMAAVGIRQRSALPSSDIQTATAPAPPAGDPLNDLLASRDRLAKLNPSVALCIEVVGYRILSAGVVEVDFAYRAKNNGGSDLDIDGRLIRYGSYRWTPRGM